MVLDQVRVAAEAGFATAWSSQALGWDALTTVAAAGVAYFTLGSALALSSVATLGVLPNARSLAVSTKSHEVERLTIELESGLRTFALTEDPRFLAPF